MPTCRLGNLRSFSLLKSTKGLPSSSYQTSRALFLILPPTSLALSKPLSFRSRALSRACSPCNCILYRRCSALALNSSASKLLTLSLTLLAKPMALFLAATALSLPQSLTLDLSNLPSSFFKASRFTADLSLDKPLSNLVFKSLDSMYLKTGPNLPF